MAKPMKRNRRKNNKEEAQIRLLRRLLVSYNDFKQAVHVSSYILAAKLHHNYPDKDRHILQGLNCAMIIAYARPFSGKQRLGNDVAPNFLGGFYMNFHLRSVHCTEL